MIALLALALAAGAVMAGYSLFRRHLLSRRAPGRLLQAIASPNRSELQFWAAGIIAVVCLMVLLVTDPGLLHALWWCLLALFSVAVFEVACWASSTYQHGFFEHGLWYGRFWFRYTEIQSYEVDIDRVRLVARGRTLTFQTEGALSVEVRLKLAVEGF